MNVIERPDLLAETIQGMVAEANRRWEAFEPVAFAAGHVATPQERAWLIQINTLVKAKAKRDLENLIIFGTTDVPEEFQ